jgi:hypothetical protein
MAFTTNGARNVSIKCVRRRDTPRRHVERFQCPSSDGMVSAMRKVIVLGAIRTNQPHRNRRPDMVRIGRELAYHHGLVGLRRPITAIGRTMVQRAAQSAW